MTEAKRSPTASAKHLEIADDGFEGKVGVVEPTGSETMVFVHAGGRDILALFRERHLFTPARPFV